MNVGGCSCLLYRLFCDIDIDPDDSDDDEEEAESTRAESST